MPAELPKPKIRILLNRGKKRDAEPPMIGFVRWKYMAIPAEAQPEDPNAHEPHEPAQEPQK